MTSERRDVLHSWCVQAEWDAPTVTGGTGAFFHDENGRRYWLQTIARGDVSRTVKLPAAVEVDRIRAHVADGMLVLTMPKLAESKVHKIAIE